MRGCLVVSISFCFETNRIVDEELMRKFIDITDKGIIIPLFNLKGDITAYLIQYYSSKGIPSAYIVVDNEVNTKSYYITFGNGAFSTILDSYGYLADNPDYKILYFGGFEFFIQVDQGYYIANQFENTLDVQDLLALQNDNLLYASFDYIDVNYLLQIESGYTYWNGKFYSGDITIYKTMTETATAYSSIYGVTITNHCGPTSALNYLLYLRSQGYTLIPTAGTGWKTVFASLYNGMMSSNTTNISDYVSYTGLYLGSQGYSNPTVYSIIPVNWTTAVAYVNYAPVAMLLQDSDIYGDHYVFTIGFSVFGHSNGETNQYYEIIDGHNSGKRYVDANRGIDHIDLIYISP